MIVTIIGIEKFLSYHHHIPNGIECDHCGAQVNWDRKDRAVEIETLRSIGWTGPMNKTKADPAYPDLCPACVEKAAK